MKPRPPPPRVPPALALFAAALAGFPPALLAQERPPAEPSVILPRPAAPASPLSAEQRAFFRDLALLNASQLALAGEASGRATRSATRDFADWVRREHQTFAEELVALAKLLGDETAARAEPPPLQDRPAWANRDNEAYDEGYVRATAELGGRMIEKLEAVRRSPETTVAAFAQKHLPGLESRNQRARDLQTNL